VHEALLRTDVEKQRLEAPALPGRPLLEARSRFDLHAVQEWSGVKGGGTRQVARGNGVLERCRIHDQPGIGVERHLAALGGDGEAPELATQVGQCIAERVPRAAFLLFPPEHLRECRAGDRPFRGGENGEEGELEPPLCQRLGFITPRR